MKLMRFQPAYAALIVQTRELVYIEMWAGQMACEGLNWLLKETIQQERPNCEPFLHIPSVCARPSAGITVSTCPFFLLFIAVARAFVRLCAINEERTPGTHSCSREESTAHLHEESKRRWVECRAYNLHPYLHTFGSLCGVFDSPDHSS